MEAREEKKRKRKDEMNMKRDGGRGGWRWEAEVAGIKKGWEVHTVERKGKRETENKTAKQQRMERKN